VDIRSSYLTGNRFMDSNVTTEATTGKPKLLEQFRGRRVEGETPDETWQECDSRNGSAGASPSSRPAKLVRPLLWRVSF